jgi:hypothetical protein
MRERRRGWTYISDQAKEEKRFVLGYNNKFMETQTN